MPVADEDDDLVEGAPYVTPDEISSTEAVADNIRERAEKNVMSVLRRRQEAYRRLALDAPIPGDFAVVQEDLKRFCRGDQSTYAPDDRTHCLLTGRNEVWLRMQDHIRLTLDELVERYN